MAKPKLGFTYPTVTGETQTVAFRRILSEFPAMQAWSVYHDGNVPNWNSAWYTEAPDDTVFMVSIKNVSNSTVAGSCAVIPEALRGRVWIFRHHEPDQWRSVSDTRGDPSPTAWANMQTEFASMRAAAPWRDWIQHWACFTEDRMRTENAFWMSNWGNWMLANASIFDGVAHDVFNIGRSVVRTGAEMFSQICAFNRAGGWPIAIREWGQVTPTDSPVDSVEVANAVRSHYEWMKSNAADLDPVMVWYYNHNNVLVDPSGTRPGRPLTRDALEEIMADASTPDGPQPDPDDPQYQLGFEAGVRSRDAEVNALQDEVDELTTQVNAIPERVAAARQDGRVEAFNEMIAWAQSQVES